MYDIIFDSIFTQVPKSFNSTVALQVCFLKHLGDVVLHSSSGISLSQLVLFLHSFQTDWMMIRSDFCVEQTKISLNYYN